MHSTASATVDRTTLLLTISLLAAGIVLLYSSSGDVATDLTGDHMYFLKRQLLRVALGLSLLAIMMRVDYRILQGYSPHLMIVSLGLLLLTLIWHGATEANGVARWLPVGPVSLQTSDLARFAIIVYLAAYMDRKGPGMAQFSTGLLPPIAILGTAMLLIVLAPDFSTAALTGFLGLILIYIGGARLKHLFYLGAATLPLFIGIMLAQPYRRLRIRSFLGMDNSPDASYQISQSLIGLGNGGWLGQGLGNSVEKKLFLPAPHTDFVFAIIGEELGFIGAALLLMAFLWLFQRGVVIAKHAQDPFGMFLALGISINLMMYVLVNTGVVTQLLPNTGVPLPLISYGGTHLVFTLMSLGILLNISKATRRREWQQQLIHARSR